MHYAKLKNSARLRRVLAVLKSGQPKTTRQIVREGSVCAVNSIIAELRANGLRIECKNIKRGVFQYKLITTETKTVTTDENENYVDK